MVRHFLARALCLILWPSLIYITISAFHFLVLSYSGNGYGFFSSEFQSTLEGNELYEHNVPECESTLHVGGGVGGGGGGGCVLTVSQPGVVVVDTEED